MQLQMEVCNLSECDFLETRIIEYENYNAFMADGTWTKTKDNKQKGFYVAYRLNDDDIKYEYCPLNYNEKQSNEWEKIIMAKYGEDKWFKNGYWCLDEFSCKLVLKNKLWVVDAIPKLAEVWKTIEYERIHGFEHRLPKTQTKKQKEGICLIKL